MSDNLMSDEPQRSEQINFTKGGGLATVVVQDAVSREVLMCAYTNREAWEATRRSGYAHYFSRSRQCLWMKGEQSGHRQRIVQILIDCDNDALLYRVEQEGVACHTGNYSCFYRQLQEGRWQPLP